MLKSDCERTAAFLPFTFHCQLTTPSYQPFHHTHLYNALSALKHHNIWSSLKNQPLLSTNCSFETSQACDVLNVWLADGWGLVYKTNGSQLTATQLLLTSYHISSLETPPHPQPLSHPLASYHACCSCSVPQSSAVGSIVFSHCLRHLLSPAHPSVPCLPERPLRCCSPPAGEWS